MKAVPPPAPVAPPPVSTPTVETRPAPVAVPVAASAPPAENEGIQLATLLVENRLLVIGVGLLLVAVVIGFMLLRRPRSAAARASLITRSMKR
jgi:hypothetical protein